MRKHTPPQNLFFLVREEIAHCPLTVPSGDTPCLTAGDARRANPWRVEKWRSGEWRSGEGEKKETSQPAPTVPGGDTPCLTAGDAQKANPWRSGEVEREASDIGGVAQHPLLLLSQRLQCDAAGVGVLSVHPPTGSPSPQLGHHPRLSMVHLRRRRELRCEDATEIVKE